MSNLPRKIKQGRDINNDAPNRCELNHPYIMVCKQPLIEIKDVIPVLELVKQRNAELFVIASEISEKALSSLLFNHIKGIVKVTDSTTLF